MIVTPEVLASLHNKIVAHVLKTDSCWLWTKGKGSHGYGEVYYGKGNQFLVHRVALAIKENLDLNDDSWLACHIDICLHRHCINPDHLYKGTYETNNNDIFRLKGKHHWEGKRKPTTHCKRGHELTPENRRTVNRGYACKKCDWLRNHKMI